MRKTITKVIPAVKAKPERTVEVEVPVCDVCGKEQVKHYNKYSMDKCMICKRDLCRNTVSGHFAPFTCFVNDPEDYGDYPSKMCIICEPLYYKIIAPMQRRHEEEEEKLLNGLKERSLESSIS